jgi:DNA-binding response OmpR family regulator
MKTILIVARDRPGRTALARRLDQEGYLVVAVTGPAEAAEFLDGIVPGVIIIDLPTSRGESTRMVKALRADAQLRMIPRLLLLRRLQAADASAAAVFVKPLDLDHLVRALGGLFPRPRTQGRRPPVAATRVPVAPRPRPAPPLVPVGINA